MRLSFELKKAAETEEGGDVILVLGHVEAADIFAFF